MKNIQADFIMQKAIIVDLDEVLFQTNFIFEEIEQKNIPACDKWDYFHSNVHRCTVNEWCKNLVEKYSNDAKIIFLTARSDEIREITTEMLKALFDFDFILLMRPLENELLSWKLKENHLKKIKDRYEILFALDDELKNCLMYQENGVVVLKVLQKVGCA